MITFPINSQKAKENEYSVIGTLEVNGKEKDTKFKVFAKTRDIAKDRLATYASVRHMKYNLQTLTLVSGEEKKED